MSVPKKKLNRKRKKVQTCAQMGTEGRAFILILFFFFKRRCFTFWGQNTWDEGDETEGDCWRICVHLNPEREKVTDSHRNFQLFSFLTDHISVFYALPLQAPLGLWQHCERCFKSPRVVVVVVSGGILTPKSEISAVALWAYTLCLSVSLCAHTHTAKLT